MDSLKIKLAVMNFLQFAIWGSYLTTMGVFLGSEKVNLGTKIGNFYAAQGWVSLFFPALMGMVADRWIQAQLLYQICHFLSALFMIGVGFIGIYNPSFYPLFTCFFFAIGFYMATLSLSYAVAYNALEKKGYDTEKSFPPIRFFGTAGFIVTMWIVDLCKLISTPYQFFVAGGIGIVLTLYAFIVPKCEINKDQVQQSFISRLGLDAFKLFREYKMAAFFIFSMLLGVALQITNSFANPYIQAFAPIEKYKGTFGVEHSNIIISISQISECFCILLIPFFLKRFGIKIVMLIAMVAWVFRFFFFGLGNPGSGVFLFIISCIVYGVAFDFFNVSGSLFVNKETDDKIRSSAQGLFMLMTNGIGSIIGTYGAQAIINKYVNKCPDCTNVDVQIKGWRKSWYIFSAYALIISILFVFLFRYNHKDELKSEEKKNAEEIELGKVEN